jgi:hypothetical protein
MYNILPITEQVKFEATKYHAKDLIKQLHNLQGFKGSGFQFNDVVYTAICYFFENIYIGTPKDNDWNIKKIKGYFDACNYSPYTPVVREVSKYHPLTEAPLFDEVFLIINTAYHFGTKFESNQFLNYLYHYKNTGCKLDDNLYNGDLEHLHRKYNEIDQNKINIDIQKRYWYYSTIELMLNELQIVNPNFRQFERENEHRIFNNFALVSKALRVEQPFLIGEFDISSAYPTILDDVCGSTIAPNLYNTISLNFGINRNDAKSLFNKQLNRYKYRRTKNDFKEYKNFLMKCGYLEHQAETIKNVTDDPTESFYDFGTSVERELIELFKKENALFRSTRVHDAICFLVRNDINYNIVKTDFDPYNFKYKRLNGIKYNETFFNGNRWLNSRSFQFLPKGIKGIHNIELKAPATSIGRIKETFTIETKKGNKDIYLDIEFFDQPSQYITANFDVVDNDRKPIFESIGSLLEQYYKSFGFITANTKLHKRTVVTILQHHRKFTNLCFDIETVAEYITNMDFEKSTFEVKERYFKFYNDVSNLENEVILFSAIKKAESKIKRNARNVKLVNEFISFMESEKNTLFRPALDASYHNDKMVIGFINYINKKCFGRVTEFKGKSVTKSEIISRTYISTLLSALNKVEKCNKTLSKTRCKTRKAKLLQQKKELLKKVQKCKDDQAEILSIYNHFLAHKFNAISTDILNPDFIKNLIEAHKSFISDYDQLKPVGKNNLQWDRHDPTHSIFYNNVPTIKELARGAYLTPYLQSFKRYHSKNWIEVYRHIENGTFHQYKENVSRQYNGIDKKEFNQVTINF